MAANRQTFERLLKRMPEHIVDTFSDEQLAALEIATQSDKKVKKTIDSRGSFFFPFYQWRFYYVFMVGKDRRQLSQQERQVALFTTLSFAFIFVTFIVGFLVLALYLLKSFLGIDLIPSMSLGIWDWFKQYFL